MVMTANSESDTDSTLGAAFDRVVDALRRQPASIGLVLAQQWQDRLAGVEAELLARGAGPSANRQAKRRLAGAASTRSSREADRRTRQADVVGQNPLLGAAVARGDLGTGQLDAIADAAAESDGAAATDDELIEQVGRANPDQARDLARRWLDRRVTADQRERDHQRHRRRRHVRTYETNKGTWALLAEGDRVSIDEMSRHLDALADAAYQHDGGRHVPKEQHLRTADQRRYDALHDRLTGAGRPSTPAARRRPTIHLAATVHDLFGAGRDPAEIIGAGPLPHLVLERYWCDAEIIGSIYDGRGQPLWQGGSVRTATKAQLDALIARDRGCVLCRADHSRCEAHHLVPVSAPAKGRTDIEQLVLVCSPCHHLIHDNRLTVIGHPDTGGWTTRPATGDELPSRLPPHQRSP